ncbi:ABC transporter G family member 10-like [Actinidia eriantha]|uniref:ABC transporter G family member 10-like n=1 Tax=Actinidia eriantha TaxID=165200 RepID=UPI002583C53E|nr:ABC transporter G family member 10-like [Actinidia eriantha]
MELPVSGGKRPSYKLETKNLSYTFCGPYDELNWIPIFKSQNRPAKFILHDVNCEARPGEITAIAGPSGAGKTTLLEIMSGKISPGKVSGRVLINHFPMDAKCFRRISGYVTQDDALFPHLTVEETLMYSALLRLPGGGKEAKSRVRVLMNELGLGQVSGSRVGYRSNRGISGGERRRVSIGVELVHDPAVVLIDEPTSGLDSGSALQVVTLLKSMVVNRGKTIILTIHQPGFRILKLLDRVVVLSNGAVMHNGSLKLLQERLDFAGYCLPRHINVLEFAIDVMGRLVIQTSASFNNQFALTDHYEEARDREPKNGIEEKLISSPNSQFKEVLILGQRFCKNVFRTKQLFATRVIQVVVAGLVLGTIFMNVGDDHGRISLQTRIGFFAFSLTFLLSSTTEGLPIFLQERGIIEKETSRGAYRVSSYVIANTLVFIPVLLIVGLLYASSVYFLVGLRREIDGFLYFSLVVWMVLLVSNSFTACFSALVPNFIMGTSLIAGLMGSFFLFSGYFIREENIPKYWIFMHYLSLFKYPFECFMINEYGGEEGRRRCLDTETGVCKLYGDGFLKQQGIKESKKWSNLGVMLGFILGYRVFCFLILWYRCYKTRK